MGTDGVDVRSFARVLVFALAVSMLAAVPASAQDMAGPPTWQEPVVSHAEGEQMVALRVEHADRIWSLDLHAETTDFPQQDGSGIWHDIVTTPGDHIVRVDGQWNDRGISQLTFTTARGIVQGPYGQGGGESFDFVAPDGQGMVGMRTVETAGSGVYQFAPIWGEVDPVVPLDEPIGGPAGTPFADAVTDRHRLRRLTIRYGSWIDAVELDSSIGLDGTLGTWGGTGGTAVQLNIPEGSQVVEVFGATDGEHVTSLGIRTDDGLVFGPFGLGQGTPFQLIAPEGHVIRGLHGRAGRYLNAIGVVTAPHDGPWGTTTAPVGGTGGQPFVTTPEQWWDAIAVRAGAWIDGLRIDSNNHITGRQIGGTGGTEAVLDLDHDRTRIQTVFGTHDGEHIRQLGFRTITGQQWGPVGTGGDQAFELHVPVGHRLIGFHGRAGSYLDALGIVTEPWFDGRYRPSSLAGGTDGTYWEHRISAREIRVRAGAWIDGLTIVGGDGTTIEHGGTGGTEHIWTLQQGERVTEVFGTVDDTVVRQLGVRTSTGRTLGPVGTGGEEAFALGASSGQINGFHGRSTQYLNAIGVLTSG